ncbi:MAG: acyltransferase [Acetatifactor sp.]|nr:acyltransferase [Acetatifactor sp.]
MNEKRTIFLDILRVAATCAVVMLHVISGALDLEGVEILPVQKNICLALFDVVTWCVPIFVLISGYLFLNPEREISFQKMLSKYIRRIVLALFIFGVPYALLEMIATERTFHIIMIPKAFWMVCIGQSWAHMWYLYLIFCLYLLTPGLKWVLRRIPIPAVYFVEMILFVGSSIFPFLQKLSGVTIPVCLPDECIYLFYYICGYLFVRNTKVQQKNNSGIIWGESALIFLLMSGMVISRFSENYSVQMAYEYPFAVLLAILLFDCLRNLDSKMEKLNTVCLEKLSALSFAVYLVHPIFTNILYKGFHLLPFDFALWMSLPIFFAGVLLASVGLAILLRKVSFLQKYVL